MYKSTKHVHNVKDKYIYTFGTVCVYIRSKAIKKLCKITQNTKAEIYCSPTHMYESIQDSLLK